MAIGTSTFLIAARYLGLLVSQVAETRLYSYLGSDHGVVHTTGQLIDVEKNGCIRTKGRRQGHWSGPGSGGPLICQSVGSVSEKLYIVDPT